MPSRGLPLETTVTRTKETRDIKNLPVRFRAAQGQTRAGGAIPRRALRRRGRCCSMGKQGKQGGVRVQIGAGVNYRTDAIAIKSAC